MKFPLTDRCLSRLLIAVSVCGLSGAATVLPGCIRNPWTLAVGRQDRLESGESSIQRTAAWAADRAGTNAPTTNDALVASETTTAVRPFSLRPAVAAADDAGPESRLEAVLKQRRRDQTFMAEQAAPRSVPASQPPAAPNRMNERPARINPWEPQIAAQERARQERAAPRAVARSSVRQSQPALANQGDGAPQNQTNRFAKNFDARLDALRRDLDAREGARQYAGKSAENKDATPFWAEFPSQSPRHTPIGDRDCESTTSTPADSSIFDLEPRSIQQPSRHADDTIIAESQREIVRFASIDSSVSTAREAVGPRFPANGLEQKTSASQSAVRSVVWDDDDGNRGNAALALDETSAEANPSIVSQGGVRLLPPIEDLLTLDVQESEGRPTAGEDRRFGPGARNSLRFTWPTDVPPAADGRSAPHRVGPERIDTASRFARPISPHGSEKTPDILLDRGAHRLRFTEHASSEDQVSAMQLAEYKPLAPVRVAQAPPLEMTGRAPSRTGGLQSSNRQSSTDFGVMPDARWRVPLFGLFGGLIVTLAVFRICSRSASRS